MVPGSPDEQFVNPLKRNKILLAASLLCLAFIAPGPWALAQSEEEAYEHNRQGMIAMSEAEFEKAIVEFQKAAALAKDYQIRGRSLIYTPVFMTAWAYEKIGRVTEACGAYQRFLEIAPPDAIEPTKAEHARDYWKVHCGR
jgi:tetratricopeptide (TPR) repeat protein